MNISLVLISVACLAWGCTAPLAAVEIVAHRGASADAPENTLASFRLAWEQGADAIEGDFYLTSDGRIITIHDPTTKRTTGVDWVVEERTFDELRTLDAGSWKGQGFGGQRLPTLKEVLETIPPGKGLRLEVKCGPQIVSAIARDLEESNISSERIVIICFKEEVIQTVKERMPHIKAVWLVAFKRDKETGQLNTTPAEIVSTAKRIKADGVSLGYKEGVDEACVAALRKAGLEFHVWTVNDVEDARRMIALGALSITTDRPAALRQELGMSPAEN